MMRRFKRVSLGLVASGLVMASTVGGLVPTPVAMAHCIGSSTLATTTGQGREYHLNSGTCDGDLTYTARFEDLSTSVSIRMQWDADQNGTYEGASANSSSSISTVISGLLWTYGDTNSASYFRICHTNGGGGVIACATRGTNSGY